MSFNQEDLDDVPTTPLPDYSDSCSLPPGYSLPSSPHSHSPSSPPRYSLPSSPPPHSPSSPPRYYPPGTPRPNSNRPHRSSFSGPPPPDFASISPRPRPKSFALGHHSYLLTVALTSQHRFESSSNPADNHHRSFGYICSCCHIAITLPYGPEETMVHTCQSVVFDNPETALGLQRAEYRYSCAIADDYSVKELIRALLLAHAARDRYRKEMVELCGNLRCGQCHVLCKRSNCGAGPAGCRIPGWARRWREGSALGEGRTSQGPVRIGRFKRRMDLESGHGQLRQD
ncbi:hypothetical protein BJ508DRAFT_329720 [Ascobolus immersus RN42]|uniref:Uncharacterized protein n=1 Tax=Ascobolus immersus RN42 TaxID=1160509 RepID=A0A3N4I148_ASCIM|nr:hypothetical protein BJ508DRAFT_329720 [Ascobolus immersus RN42]